MTDEVEIRHLHKNYNTTFCGEDASHLPMTFEVGNTTCDKCLTALDKARDQLKKLDDEAKSLNEDVETTNKKYYEDLKARENQHTADLSKLGERATDLTERRKGFTDEYTNIPSQPE